MSTSERWSNLNQLPVNRFFKVEPNPRNWLPAMFFEYQNDRQTHTFNFEHEYRRSLRLITHSAVATQEQRLVATWLHENVTKKHFLAGKCSVRLLSFFFLSQLGMTYLIAKVIKPNTSITSLCCLCAP